MNFEMMGAVGDGLTDNTEALTNALLNLPENGTLFIPPGIFRYHQINVKKSNINIVGHGGILESTFKVEEGGANGYNIFRINGSNVTLKNLNFRLSNSLDYDTDYRPKNYANGHHIRLGSDQSRSFIASNLRIIDCVIDGGYGGAIDFWYGENIEVLNTRISNTLGNGIFFSNCIKNITVNKVEINRTRDDCLFIASDASLPELTRNIKIINSTFSNTYAKGIGTSGVDGVIIENCYVNNTWAGGIQPFRDTNYSLNISRNIQIINCTINNAGKNYGIGKFKTQISSNADGIYIGSQVSNVFIGGETKIVSPARFGIVAVSGSNRITINRVDIQNTISAAINIGNTKDTQIKSGDNFNISEVYINNCNAGIVVGGVRNSNLSGNIIRAWNTKNTGSTSAIFASNISNTTIKNNILIKINGGYRHITIISSDPTVQIDNNFEY